MLANEQLLQRIGGGVTIAMSVVLLGIVATMQFSWRIRNTPRRDGLWGAPLLRAVYGFGWTPCLAPTLAGVIALASGTDVGPTTGRGLFLIVAYCLGLGLPFIPIALGTRWAVRAIEWLRCRTRRVKQVGGVLLIATGLAPCHRCLGQVGLRDARTHRRIHIAAVTSQPDGSRKFGTTSPTSIYYAA